MAEKKKVKLNSPFRLPAGSKKKFGVYVKNEKGNIVKVTFGDPNMEIKRDDPNRRKNFRARHNCDNPGPKWKARYWSCYQWRAGAPVKAEIDEYVDMTLAEMLLVPTIEEESCCDECDKSIASDRPGLWENIRRKKMREGKNYRPAKPGDPDRPTKEQIEKAQSKKDMSYCNCGKSNQVGGFTCDQHCKKKSSALQYGKPSKNDPRKTPAPPKDQKQGSKRNPKDSAKTANPDIEFSKETTAKLLKVVKEHNAKNKGPKVTLSMLKAVYRRGAGAYSTSHHPSMSRDGWAMARIRAFLYLLEKGKPSNPNYVQDNDLLPKGHSKKSSAAVESTENQYRFRVKNPNLFEEGSFRTKILKDGVSIIVGKLKNGSNSTVVQAYRFDKKFFKDISEVNSWLKRNNVSKNSFDEFTKRDIFVGNQPKQKKNKKFSQKAFEILAEMNAYNAPQKPTDGGKPNKKKLKQQYK